MENKKIIIAASVLILFVLLFAAAIFFMETQTRSENYTKTLTLIEKGNGFVVSENLDDGCFPYRYFHRGCYYSEEDLYLAASDLKNYNLTHAEIIELCYKFAHKGSVAYCLKTNKEIQACNNFSEANDYLKRICNLADAEFIPSQMFGPYEGETMYDVDYWETVEPVRYSELA